MRGLLLFAPAREFNDRSAVRICQERPIGVQMGSYALGFVMGASFAHHLAERAPLALPKPSKDMIAAASRALPMAQIVLGCLKRQLLTVACDHTLAPPQMSVAVWMDQGHDLIIQPVGEEDSREPGFRGALIMLQAEMQDVCMQLRHRWPMNARPPVVGVVTDGKGLAISSGHPSGLSPEWLTEHFTGQSLVTAIVPFGPDGPMVPGARLGQAVML